jgi:hypothetical protein
VFLAGCGGSPKSGSTGGGNPTIVTYNFSSSSGSVLPVAVATQIGTGAYAAATLTSCKLTISVPNGESNFSVAFLCPSPAGTTTPQNIEIIRQASILDGTS